MGLIEITLNYPDASTGLSEPRRFKLEKHEVERILQAAIDVHRDFPACNVDKVDDLWSAVEDSNISPLHGVRDTKVSEIIAWFQDNLHTADSAGVPVNNYAGGYVITDESSAEPLEAIQDQFNGDATEEEMTVAASRIDGTETWIYKR